MCRSPFSVFCQHDSALTLQLGKPMLFPWCFSGNLCGTWSWSNCFLSVWKGFVVLVFLITTASSEQSNTRKENPASCVILSLMKCRCFSVCQFVHKLHSCFWICGVVVIPAVAAAVFLLSLHYEKELLLIDSDVNRLFSNHVFTQR